MRDGERNRRVCARPRGRERIAATHKSTPPTFALLVSIVGGALPGCLPYGRAPEAKLETPPPERYAPQAAASAFLSGGDGAPVSSGAGSDAPPAPSPQDESTNRGAGGVAATPAQPPRDGSNEAAPPSTSPPPPATRDHEQSAPAPRRAQDPNDRWWTSFGDPALNDLIDQALRENRDMRIAWERVRQARAMATQAGAAQWFQVNAQGEAGWNRAPLAFAGASADTTSLRASLPVSYEVDWFARNAGRKEAAKLDMAAARADAEAAAISVSAQVAEAWFDLLEARARVELLAEQLRINERFLELTTLRFRQGLTTALDAHQQRQTVAATQAQAALAQARERVAANQLALLLGKTPEAQRFAQERRSLPELPERPPEGVPADLLQKRPDVRAAARRVEAADERVAVAIASRLPTLTLNGSVGYQYTKFKADGFGGVIPGMPTGGGGAFERETQGTTYGVGALLNIPIFDGFQRKAEVDLSRARTREAVETHVRVLQRAVSEVDSAIASERSQEEHIAALSAQLRAAEDALDSARERYRQGLSDFLPVLQALNATQQTQLALLAARRQQLSFRVQLHRALGGTWTRELDAPRAEKGSDE